MSILFTPAGDTDPIRDCHDGAILHIIRTYKPSMVRIFLSADMTEKEEKRKIYSKAIEYNAPDCKVEFIKTAITDVHLMENLIPLASEFMKLRQEYPEEEIILNISSGTPQMKTIMSILATDFDDVRAIQVDSPSKASNREIHATQDSEDIDAVIENNFDNEPDYNCRCHEAPLTVLRRYSIKQQLVSLVNSYEYSAAFALYKKNKQLFNDEVGKLLEHADLRSKLQYDEAFKIKGTPLNNDKEIKPLNEFFMVMELRQKKGELSEFIVKITPFLYDLTKYYFQHILNFSFDRICNKSGNKWRISKDKIKEISPQLFTHLNNKYDGGFKDGVELSFSNMLNILHGLSIPDNELLEALDKLRIVEARHRNKIAHNIVNITEQVLRTTEPNLNSLQIMHLLHKVFTCVMKGKIYKRNIYDDLNKEIISSLEKIVK